MLASIALLGLSKLAQPGIWPYSGGPEDSTMPRMSLRQTPKPRARVQRLEARVTPEQKELLQRAASLQGRSLTDFVVASAQEAALRAIQDIEVMRLSAADSRIFAEALLNPRKPNRALRAAAKRYRALIGD